MVKLKPNNIIKTPYHLSDREFFYLLFFLIAKNWLSSSSCFVHTFKNSVMWCFLYNFRVLFRFFRDRNHDVNELINRFFRFCFSWFNHHTLFNVQWEVNGWWMNTKVKQSLSNIHCSYAKFLLSTTRKNKLVLTMCIVRKLIIFF